MKAQMPQRNCLRATRWRLAPSRLGKMLKHLAALCLVLLILIAGLAAVSPQFHKLLHDGAGTPQHFCLVTLLEHFHIAPVLGQVSLALVAVGALLGLLSAVGTGFPHFDYDSPPGRAPPAASSFTAVR